jgi:uncharacterized protein (DUF2062 family)/2-polyprenyl-3-methyl-5-hydroxy-6-metoxy-1,4-benzoquinol methylase
MTKAEIAAGSPQPEESGGLEPSRPPRAGRIRRLYLTLRTEHTTPRKVAAAVAVGVLVGCSPFWGLHLATALVLATIFRLNRVLVYAATNLANPLTAPPLIFAEVQVGHRLLRDTWLALTMEDLSRAGLSGLFLDFLVGSLVVGAGLAVVLGVLAYVVSRGSQLPPSYQEIVDEAVRRYLDVSLRDAEGARWRLVRDPIFRVLLDEPLFHDAGRIIDLGCGRGLVAVVGAGTGGDWLAGRSYLGVDVSERYVRAARDVLSDVRECSFVHADLRDFDPPSADLVLLLNVLRYLPLEAQDALLRRLGKVLPAGSRLLVREVDASAGWRFRAVQVFDLLSLLLPGRPRYRLGYRHSPDLKNALIAAGFEVRDRSTLHSSSRAWVLLEATRRPRSPAGTAEGSP